MVKNNYLLRRGFKMGHFWQSLVLDLLENFVREPTSHSSLMPKFCSESVSGDDGADMDRYKGSCREQLPRCREISNVYSPTQGNPVQVNMHKGKGCEAVAYTYSAKDKLDGQQEKQEHSSKNSATV